MNLFNTYFSTILTIILFSSCNNKEELLSSTIDRTPRSVNYSNFYLKNNIKSIEISYYDDAAYGYINDAIQKNTLRTKVVRNFDNDGMLTESATETKNNFKTFSTKENWTYDNAHRVTQYKNTYTKIGDSGKLDTVAVMFQFIFDDAAKVHTSKLYTQNKGGEYTLQDSVKQNLSKTNQIYAQYLKFMNRTENTDRLDDTDVYFSMSGQIDFRKSKKYLVQQIDDKGNVVLSYIKYDLKGLDGKPLTQKPSIRNYYEQIISYNDDSSSKNAKTTEVIKEESFNIKSE